MLFEIGSWLAETKNGIYYQKVQSQSTVNIGWLLWSFRRIDTVILEKELFQLYGITVHLRYQNIANGTPIQNDANIVRALHVVTDQKEADRIALLFQKTYHFKSTNFPLGIILRFVPHFSRVSKTKQSKLHKWRYKQRVFNRAIENPEKPMSSTSWEILELDKEIKGFGSLRKAIMKLHTKTTRTNLCFLVQTHHSLGAMKSFLPSYRNMKARQDSSWPI